MKHSHKAAFASLAALVVAVALAACGSSSEKTNQATTGAATTRPADSPESASMGGKVPTIVIRNGEPVGGVKELNTAPATRSASRSTPTSPTRSTSTATT